MKSFRIDQLRVQIYDTRAEMGSAAAYAATTYLRERLKRKQEIAAIFAAAPSQNEFLAALCESRDIDWTRIRAMHMDEYVGLSDDAPQRFGTFLREKIFSRIPFCAIEYLEGNAESMEAECARYEALITRHTPDVVFMGVGENGHIAFNDPSVANFEDPKLVKTVLLDERCRKQQVNDRCFVKIEDVPKTAITLTIPALVQCEKVFCMVPGTTKAEAVERMLQGPISTECPASILRKHNDATLYLDSDSASLLKGR